ncbi:MAG: contractile injection system protein, VgrG/Pvc8 family [Oceanospirillaceae bacterium]
MTDNFASSAAQHSGMINIRPRIHIDQQARDDLQEALLDMQVSLPLSGMSSLELKLSNWRGDSTGSVVGFAFQTLELGQSISVHMLDEAQMSAEQLLFSGEITALEESYGSGAPQLTILAEDSLHHLVRTRRNQVYEDQDIQQVITQIASQAGLQSEISIVSAVSDWHQMNESDLAFITRLIAPFDLALRLSDGALRIKKEQPDPEPIVIDAQGNAKKIRIIADINHQYKQLAVQGYSLEDDVAISAQSAYLATSAMQQSAQQVLQDLTWQGEQIAISVFARNQTEANAWAKARFEQRAKQFLHGDISCRGNAALHSGKEVDLKGVSLRLQGIYQIVHCRHVYSSQDGYITKLKVHKGSWNIG